MAELAGISKELLGKINEIEDELGLPKSYNAEDVGKIKWHPYSEEKPDIKFLKSYLVSREGMAKRIYTDIEIYDGINGKFFKGDDDIIAWSELPEPYKVENKKIIVTIECDVDIYNELRRYPDSRLRFVGRSMPIEEGE